mgnify:CR=1 FL=1
MPESVLEIEKDGGSATLTLNRPQARNALSPGLRSELVRAKHTRALSPEVIAERRSEIQERGRSQTETPTSSAPRLRLE